jgi:hypothetical protein
MNPLTRGALVLVVAAGVVGAPVMTAAQDTVETAPAWVGHGDEAESYLEQVEIVDLEDIGTGVTNPKRATLAPGGLVEAFAWKNMRPGFHGGFWESYTSEIAAYELDKLLDLRMTPPTVERRIRGELGAAVWWVSSATSWRESGGAPTAPNAHIGRWNFQLIRAQMFHNLVYNKDPNRGNWLFDPAWNLYIIDNSRAFTAVTGRRVHRLTWIDPDLWARMEALDEPTLQAALGEWLDDGQIRAVLTRRDEMGDDIATMVARRGESDVFARLGPGPPSSRAPSTRQATVDLDALAGQLTSALGYATVVWPASEVSWVGRVVQLPEDAAISARAAETGRCIGYMYGLLTDRGDLICLTPDQSDAAPYEMLAHVVGNDVEMFGVAQELDNMIVASVTLCRPR